LANDRQSRQADGLKTVMMHLVPIALALLLPISALAADAGSERLTGGGTFSSSPVPRPDLLAQSERLTQQAVTFYQEGRYEEAEPLFQEALAIREKALGPDDPDVATSLNNLAGLYREQGRYGEAESLYRRALVMREKLLGSNNPALAQSLNNLAALFSNQGRYSDA
jgi:tetratricopeptide (TPR) repeat protein